jgi:hypothetical protein
LKPEWWGSPLAQEEKYQGRKKTCDKKKIIIIIYVLIQKYVPCSCKKPVNDFLSRLLAHLMVIY